MRCTKDAALLRSMPFVDSAIIRVGFREPYYSTANSLSYLDDELKLDPQRSGEWMLFSIRQGALSLSAVKSVLVNSFWLVNMLSLFLRSLSDTLLRAFFG